MSMRLPQDLTSASSSSPPLLDGLALPANHLPPDHLPTTTAACYHSTRTRVQRQAGRAPHLTRPGRQQSAIVVTGREELRSCRRRCCLPHPNHSRQHTTSFTIIRQRPLSLHQPTTRLRPSHHPNVSSRARKDERGRRERRRPRGRAGPSNQR